MYVRLAFAVAAHLEPEILVVDEVLAVGDMAFQKKCLGKMSDVAKGGRTILFVSHNMGAIANLCRRGILLHRGAKLIDDKTENAIESYMQMGNAEDTHFDLQAAAGLTCYITKVLVHNVDGERVNSFDIRQEIFIIITYQINVMTRGFQIALILARNMVDLVQSFDTDGIDEIQAREPGTYEARYRVPAMFLKAGIYTVDIMTGTPELLMQELRGAVQFEVEELSVNALGKGYRKDRPGHIISPGTWEIKKL
jgi:lipopolysaccharide transport system ATP-binding protein